MPTDPELHPVYETDGWEARTPGRLLIEDWLPVRELGIESGSREANPRPPLNGFHVWWARRPLAACQGAQLAAVLPTFDALEQGEFPSSQAYREWVVRMVGIWGDVVAVKARIDRARATGENLGSNPYGYRPAFNNSPSIADLNKLHRILKASWGRLPVVLDPTAGGGAIPLAAIRYGLPAIANDLNPVAVTIQEATLKSAAQYGTDLIPDIETWSERFQKRLADRLAPYFERDDEAEHVIAYLWVNTIECPRTGGPVPLAPNWWLNKHRDTKPQDRWAVRPVPVRDASGEPSHLEWEMIQGPTLHGYDPDDGTVSRGTATSPWDGLVIDGDYIKGQAVAGRMWPTFYGVACSRPRRTGRGKLKYFRAPTETDLMAVNRAEDEVRRMLPAWEEMDLIPNESIPAGNKTDEPRRYGMFDWRDLFTPRQLLVEAVFVEEWRNVRDELRQSFSEEQRAYAETLAELLAVPQNKFLNYNSRLSIWHPSQNSMANVFNRHDLAFAWTHGEFEGAQALPQWAFSATFAKFAEIARIASPGDDGGLGEERLGHPVPGPIELFSVSASNLDGIADGTIECVNIDPPYYNNVMYAELADFFYVWEKRTIGTLHPERFADDLTDKDNEAVANEFRYADTGRRRKELARFDYQQKMQAIFAEARRVLRDDGVLVVWFTHKAADAWDTLGAAMIDAGFTIETSWPINTESSQSLHQAKKNAAASTIVLVCRKRQGDSDGIFFEEIEAEVRRAAVDAVQRFGDAVGITGVDLLLSTYGPTLSVISTRWPVLSDEAGEDGRARRLRPEEALAVAREEVNRLIKSRLVGHAAQFDNATDFWLLSWANFQAREFPYDEARKLGMSTLDVDDAVQAGLVKKKAGKVELVKPASRGRTLRSKMADNGRFPTLVDALHHLMNSYRDDGLASTRTWLADSGYGDERAFLDTLQASVNAIPRVRTKKGLSVPEAQELEDVVIALFGDKVELPAEVEELIEAQQTSLEV